MSAFTGKRYGGYECSSRGDQRFSAFRAMLEDGRSIEQHYQCDVKGYQPGGFNWKLGKGRPPLYPMSAEEQYECYLHLWMDWADRHPEHMKELRENAVKAGYALCDRFATSPINQARALAELLNRGYGL